MGVHLVSHPNMHTDVSCTTSVITHMRIIVAGRLHRAVVDSMRVRVLLENHKTNACNVTAMVTFMLSIVAAKQLSGIPVGNCQDSPQRRL